MYDRQHRESFATATACAASPQRKAEVVEARTQFEQCGDEQEEMGRQSLHRLQEWICELLIQNQELRMSLLNSATNHHSWEADQ